jgi:hypothetical protein
MFALHPALRLTMQGNAPEVAAATGLGPQEDIHEG